MIKAVIFDMDNTLFDFMRMKRSAVDSAVEAMIDAGLKVKKEKLKEEIFALYGKEGIEDQQIFDKVLQNFFGQIDYKILAAGIIGYRRAKEGTLVLYPNVRYTLTQLCKMGIKMGVVSDAPRLPVWMRIVGLELHHFFECVITPEDTGVKKPSPEPFLMALKILGVMNDEALMVGDWAERDIVGAKKVGIKTVFAKYGNEFATENSNADFEINDIIEIIEIIKNLNNLKE